MFEEWCFSCSKISYFDLNSFCLFGSVPQTSHSFAILFKYGLFRHYRNLFWIFLKIIYIYLWNDLTNLKWKKIGRWNYFCSVFICCKLQHQKILDFLILQIFWTVITTQGRVSSWLHINKCLPINIETDNFQFHNLHLIICHYASFGCRVVYKAAV